MEYPKISFGTYRLGNNTYSSLEYALINGYRSIDTASLYNNEHIIGKYLNENEINRNELWITSKLNPKIFINTENDIIHSINKTLDDLNTKYLDLYLIHCPKEEHIIKCWNILESYYKQGIFKNIGVSNFDINHIDIIKSFSTCPIFTNQIELSPFIKRHKLINYMNNNNIIVSAHSSLSKGEKFNDDNIQYMSKKYNKSPAQIMLKWALQNNYYIMPRSSNKQHIKDNISLDFYINDDDINELNNINITHITHPQYLFNN
jgi:diketogulonate reductase-like aldo/keto reductase